MVLEAEWCPMCGYVRKDSAHLFIKCKKVKEVWRDLELEGTRMRMENTIMAGEALNIIWELPEKKRMEVLHFMWHWWNNRNKKRNGEQVKSEQVIAHDAQVSTTEYMDLWPKEKRRNTEEKKWQCPRQENLKFNVDVSFIPETNTAARGVIVWYHARTVVACKAGQPSMPLMHMRLSSGL
ncbi:hypothetical protein ZWY2020_013019 [Hordeum vulgare]|nr:hypothetical protein ZWY2020_013019 [Hordeum vulgare]